MGKQGAVCTAFCPLATSQGALSRFMDLGKQVPESITTDMSSNCGTTEQKYCMEYLLHVAALC